MRPLTLLICPTMRALALHNPADAPAALQQQGWAVLDPDSWLSTLGHTTRDVEALHGAWADLPPDTHLRDGGHYRFRRHSCFQHDVDNDVLQQTPHRAHWQPVTYNALHGGFERLFEPVRPKVCASPLWRDLLCHLGQVFAEAMRHKGIEVPAWFIEAHQFRVDTTGGIGRPTPEGAHRDGVDFVAVVFMGRQGVKGGETRVFDAHGPHGVRFTLEAPFSCLLLDDERVVHESTPIQPVDDHGWRDTLVLTYRQHNFQGPA
jgi:hypothetical protein